MALTEGVGRARVVDFVPSERRATALGLYQGAMGGMVLLSSVIAGVLWDLVDPSAPFFLGGATALAALALLLVALPRRPDCAALRLGELDFMLHADHTYDVHPWSRRLGRERRRGLGAELRLFGVDPDAAVSRAREGGAGGLVAGADKAEPG